MEILNIPKDPKDTTVIVAMSGGVDSSTVAAILKEKGYNVIGITLQLYDAGLIAAKSGTCCAGKDIYDAKRVCDFLNISHYVLDYEKIFKQEVIEDFADSYAKGLTPIPCIKCNQTVKFRDLLNTAKELGGDALITGHYVRRIDEKGEAQLLRGVDPKKDQSYFLFATTKKQLEYTYFPIGGMNKDETRALAAKYELPVAKKSDSQDICFVGDNKYSDIIKKIRPQLLEKGDILYVNGEKIAEHEGIINYTLGQRKGLGIAWPEPLYVVKIDAANKQVIVGPKEALNNIEFYIKEINWLGSGSNMPLEGIEATVKLRSAHQGAEAKIIPLENNRAIVKLFGFEKAVTPGQACVMYAEDRVLGGGWIESVIQ